MLRMFSYWGSRSTAFIIVVIMKARQEMRSKLGRCVILWVPRLFFVIESREKYFLFLCVTEQKMGVIKSLIRIEGKNYENVLGDTKERGS